MSADTIDAGQPARASVAGEVRAEMARKRMTGRELSRLTGKSQPYWSRRLTGDVAFDVDDLVTVAALLDVPVTNMFRTLPADLIGVKPRYGVPAGGVMGPEIARDDLALAA